MKISEKEKILLGFLLVGAVGVGYYYLGYKPHTEKITALNLELETKNKDYSKKQSEIAAIPKNEKDIQLLNFSMEDANEHIYPDIVQAKLIKELTDLKNKVGLDIQFSFSELTYAPISEYFVSKEEEKVMANSLDALIEEFNAKMPEEEKITYKQEIDKNIKKDEKKEEAAKEDPSINVKQMIVTGNFQGSYEKVVKFVEALEKYKYLIAVPDITMTPSGNEEMSGAMTMEFYSAPRLNGEFDGYYDWKAEGKSGKDNPFKDGYTTISGVDNEETEEFSMVVTLRPDKSDMPAVTLGRPNDPTGRTKIISDDNGLQEGTIEFIQKDDKYFVKYQLGSQVYPKGGEIEFIPKGNIKVNVSSEKRMDGSDKVALKLNVKNSTDKKVSVEITGDDKANPRVKMNTNGDVQYVTK
ncbi:MAG: hypothetical protein ACRCWM_12430 [Sarcina sp.]